MNNVNEIELDQIELIDDLSSNPYDTSSPIPIYGEDKYCNPIQKEKFGYKYETAVIMGLYNTGTNILIDTLMKNCWGINASPSMYINHTREHFDQFIKPKINKFKQWKFKSIWNISKHQPSPSMEYLNENGIDYIKFSHEQLHIVPIKDPLTWIKSVCKESYYIFPIRNDWFHNNLCPYNLSTYNGTASANEWHTTIYSSLIQTWNKYYESWMGSQQTPPQGGTDFVKTKWRKLYEYGKSKFIDKIINRNRNLRYKILQHTYSYLVDNKNNDIALDEIGKEIMKEAEVMRTNVINLPVIVVRFEDILFHPDQIVNRLCKCVDGYRRRNGTLTKERSNKPHGKSRNRTQALTTYANGAYRYENYGKHDLKFIKENINNTILKLFRYEISTDVITELMPHNYKPIKWYNFY